MMKKSVTLALLFCAVAARAALKTEVVDYKDGKTVLQGYLAYDDARTGKRPGVIVVHEWWGHGPYARKRADMLAQLGYVAFAVDMYGKGVTAKDHSEAAKLSGLYRNDRNLMRGRAKAGLDFLTKNPRVDPGKVAAVGYCFGGTTALEMARAGMPLVGVASFHGGLDTPLPAAPGAIKAKVIVFQGADDAWTLGGLAGFQDEMKRAGADWQVVMYGGAVHSFTVPDAGDDPSVGMAYNEKADLRSWAVLEDFLKEVFK